MSYSEILIEVSNACNGKCKYCTTGLHHHRTNGFIDKTTFSEILKNCINKNIIGFDSIIHLYNWGEISLHPNIMSLIDVINSMNVPYGVSTNAFKLIDISSEVCKNLKRILFSISGFSQETYKIIHGFDIDIIKKNIKLISKEIQHINPATEILIVYHVYKFNVHEITQVKQFAKDLGIKAQFNYALINDWWDSVYYTLGGLSLERRKDIENELFIDIYNKQVSEAFTNHRSCPYKNNPFVIDIHGNVQMCCILPNNHINSICGNIITDTIESILEHKKKMAVCTYCEFLGIPYHFFAKTMEIS